MAEKWQGIIENLEVDQYLEAQGYMKYDNTINIEYNALHSQANKHMLFEHVITEMLFVYAFCETDAAWNYQRSRDQRSSHMWTYIATCAHLCASIVQGHLPTVWIRSEGLSKKTRKGKMRGKKCTVKHQNPIISLKTSRSNPAPLQPLPLAC